MSNKWSKKQSIHNISNHFSLTICCQCNWSWLASKNVFDSASRYFIATAYQFFEGRILKNGGYIFRHEKLYIYIWLPWPGLVLIRMYPWKSLVATHQVFRILIISSTLTTQVLVPNANWSLKMSVYNSQECCTGTYDIMLSSGYLFDRGGHCGLAMKGGVFIKT